MIISLLIFDPEDQTIECCTDSGMLDMSKVNGHKSAQNWVQFTARKVPNQIQQPCRKVGCFSLGGVGV